MSDHTAHPAPNQGTGPSSLSSNEKTVLPVHKSVNDRHHALGHTLFRINTAGESGRRGIHPMHFLKVCFKSTTRVSCMVNVLWPFVPAAFAVHFARPDLHVWDFALVCTTPSGLPFARIR